MEKNLPAQKIDDGYGAKYHRVYSIRVKAPLEEARQAMVRLKVDPNDCTPQILATFEKTDGESRALREGDEFQIHISGPWNGPVRVKSTTEDGFTLETLEGHLEAGQIVFRLKKISEKETLFEIESIARSRDRVVDFFYDKIPIAKAAQTQMWSSFCKSFAEQACGEQACSEEVEIRTERFDEESQTWQEA